jgi:hypothetical protein
MAAAPAVRGLSVTVVIPTRQRAHVLPAAMDSVLAQDLRDLRLLICDNASEDGTAEIVGRYAAADPRVVYHRHPHDVGATANFQWGMDAVETDCFVLLSDDDLLLPGFLARALTALQEEGRPAMFCGASVVYDARDGSHRLRPARGWAEGLHRASEHVARILEHHFLWTGVVFRTEVREALGRFEPVPLVDVLYLAKVAARFPFVVSLTPCAVFRLTGGNAHLTVTPEELERTRLAMREAVAALPLPTPGRAAALAAVEGNVRGVAHRALREALAARRLSQHAELARYMALRGWLPPWKRVRVAVGRYLPPPRRRVAAPARSLEEVARMYAPAPPRPPR